MPKSVSLQSYVSKKLKSDPEFKKEYEKLQKKYEATITFIDGKVTYMEVNSHNKESAKLRVKLARQRIGDEMFVRSIKLKLVKG